MLENKEFYCVNLGDQQWTTKNLDIDHFRNGDLISESKTYQEWILRFGWRTNFLSL